MARPIRTDGKHPLHTRRSLQLGHSLICTSQRTIPVRSSSSRRSTLAPTGRPALCKRVADRLRLCFPVRQNAASASAELYAALWLGAWLVAGGAVIDTFLDELDELA